MKLVSLLLRFLQFTAALATLALGISLASRYQSHYHPRYAQPTVPRYGAWAGGFGILIAVIGTVLTVVGKGGAVLMIALDALGALFWLVCGVALVPLLTSYHGKGRWKCKIDAWPGACRRIRDEARWDTAISFVACVITIGLLVLAFRIRRKNRRAGGSSA